MEGETLCFPFLDCIAIIIIFEIIIHFHPNSPANSLAAQLYQENRREYEKKVQAIVEESWMNA